MRTRTCFLALCVLAASLPACGFFADEPPKNLLVIVVDSLRFDALSRSVGSARTPSFQQIAQDGVSFSWCFSHSSADLPAQAAIFSGLEPGISGVRNDRQGIDVNVSLLAEHLSDQGFETFADVSLSTLEARGGDIGLSRGFATWRTHESEVVSADQVNTRALAFLEQVPKDKPWFAFVQYSDPAEPREGTGGEERTAEVSLDDRSLGSVRTSAAAEWKSTFELGSGVHRLVFRADAPFELRNYACTLDGRPAEPRFEEGRAGEALSRLVLRLENTSDSPVTCNFSALVHDVPTPIEARARYKREVERVDRAIGALIASLQTSGQYERTCIIVTGDHGESLGEHGLFGHGRALHDELLRVPLIVKPIGGDERRGQLARDQSRPVRHIDVAPTVLELLDLKPLPGARGVSLLQPAERRVVAEVHPPEAESMICMFRDDRYKLVFIAGEDRFEMFDVRADTLELENVFELQGHFRLPWQRELRALAEGAPQAANLQMRRAAEAQELAR